MMYNFGYPFIGTYQMAADMVGQATTDTNRWLDTASKGKIVDLSFLKGPTAQVGQAAADVGEGIKFFSYGTTIASTGFLILAGVAAWKLLK